MRVVFVGTGDFACPILDRLTQVHDVALVLTQPDRPVGRHAVLAPPPVKKLAQELGLRIEQPERINRPEALNEITASSPRALVVADYGQLLRAGVLEAAPLGAINVHASLLPAYRGAAPVQWAVIQGETTTGVTTFRIDEGMDTGPILLQRPLAIGEDEAADALEKRLSEFGAEILIETLAGLADGTLVARPQPEAGVSLAPKLSRDVGRIDWSGEAAVVHALVRGTRPWPSAWTTLDGERIKILRTARSGVGVGPVQPGEIGPRETGRLFVGCRDELIELVELQREGRPPTDGRSFLNGLRGSPRFV
jgi:methionyl-tRNA formyltransferase